MNISNPDRAVKHEITQANLQQCYENLKKLQLHHYTYSDIMVERKNDRHQIGFLSDEVKQIFPKSVYDMPFKAGPLKSIQTINYEQIHMTHLGTTQLLLQKIEEQQSTIQSLQNTLQSILDARNQ